MTQTYRVTLSLDVQASNSEDAWRRASSLVVQDGDTAEPLSYDTVAVEDSNWQEVNR
jgi:hypothetical protein